MRGNLLIRIYTVKKAHENRLEQNVSPGVNSGAETRQSGFEHPINVTGGQKQRRSSAVIYEEGDLRGIVAKTLAESKDPYCALSEAGVIKNAAEFFNDSVR